LTYGSLKTTVYMHMQLKEWRTRRGLSLRKLGALSGVHYVSLVKLEGGNLDPQLSTLIKICKALQITLDQLVDFRHSKKGR
jgi:transcriptional regulator with XRE-family HTH domain